MQKVLALGEVKNAMEHEFGEGRMRIQKRQRTNFFDGNTIFKILKKVNLYLAFYKFQKQPLPFSRGNVRILKQSMSGNLNWLKCEIEIVVGYSKTSAQIVFRTCCG